MKGNRCYNPVWHYLTSGVSSPDSCTVRRTLAGTTTKARVITVLLFRANFEHSVDDRWRIDYNNCVCTVFVYVSCVYLRKWTEMARKKEDNNNCLDSVHFSPK